MYRSVKKKRSSAKLRKIPAFAIVLMRGISVSVLFSLVAIVLVSICLVLIDSSMIEQHFSYIMVGITLMSIFIGSIYAAFVMKSKGLLVGTLVGIGYVSLSIVLGIYLSADIPSMLIFINKYVAGMAAGALGGLLGISLS